MPLFMQAGLVPITPFLVANNVGIAANATSTYTCTGGSTGVPSGARAVMLYLFCSPNTGLEMRISPHGTAWAAGTSPEVGSAPNSSIMAGMVFVQVDVNGQIDVKANGFAVAGLYLGIAGYVY